MSKYTKRPMLDKEVCVHVMSRVVQKRFLLDEKGMEEMRRILRTQAVFAGLDVVTFSFLRNHFHILLHIDPKRAREAVSDEELVDRFRSLYGAKRSPSLGADAEMLEFVLKENGERARVMREKLKTRMGDISVFMRELKTRFTFWYNKHYHTVGTFWAERFRSVSYEPASQALKSVAAYIDLNAVRAGLAENPQAYRFCGLGEASHGRPGARAGYAWLARRRGKWAEAETGDDGEARVFPDYCAYVNRLLTSLRRQAVALGDASLATPREPDPA